MRQVFRIILDILREISDESAYKRHLRRMERNILRRSGVGSAMSGSDRSTRAQNAAKRSSLQTRSSKPALCMLVMMRCRMAAMSSDDSVRSAAPTVSR